MTFKRLIGLLVGVVGSRFLGAGIGFASQLVLTRMLPAEDVGHVFVGMSAAAFISLAAIGGHSFLALTQLPKLAAHGRKHLVRAFHAATLTDSLVLGLVITVVLGLVLWLVPMAHGIKMALFFGWLCAPASGLLRYNSSAASSDRQFRISYTPDFLVRPALFLAGLLLLQASAWAVTTSSVLTVFVAITFATAIGQALLLADTGLIFADLRRPRAALAMRLRQRAFALTIVSAVSFAFADIVTLVAGFVLHPADVAVAGVAIRLAALAGFALQAAQSFVLPDLTQAVVTRDAATQRKLLLRVNMLTVGMSVLALAGAAVLGEWALGLFGAEYRRGSVLLLLFLGGQAIRAMGGMNQHLLSINGNQLRTAGACLLALVIFVCLAILLCGRFGLPGLGYAVIGAEFAWAAGLAAQAQRLCGTRGDVLWLALGGGTKGRLRAG